MGRLASKELVEILRDRRTVVTLVLMPLLVYPLMGIVVQKMIVNSVLSQEEQFFKLGFEFEDDARKFHQLLGIGESVLESEKKFRVDSSKPDDDAANSATVKLLDSINTDKPELNYVFDQGPVDKMVDDGLIDIGVVVEKPSDGPVQLSLLYDPQSVFATAAIRYVGRRLRVANEEFVKKWSVRNNAPLQLPAVFREEPRELETEQASLLTFVPLMLVLMTITGAVYPAIDLTAGERERGTMEILVAAPISRYAVLIGKFFAVFAVAILTAVANLVAMFVTIYALGLDNAIFGDDGIEFTSIVTIFLLLLVLAGFFSAVLLCLTSFARSFKEAQAYLIPLMLVAFAPGLISLSPNMETTTTMATVPLVNVVLVGRDLLSGQINGLHLLISVVSTALYGVLALSVASRIFGADSILMGGRSSWSELLQTNESSKPVPELSTAMFFLSILFSGFVVVVGLVNNVSGKLEATIQQRLIVNALVTVVLFVGLPILFSIIAKPQLKTTYFFEIPRWTYCFAAVLLGCSLWVIAYELEIIGLGNNERLERLVESFEGMKDQFAQIPLAIKLVCLAIVPAVCEEWTFRGFLLSSIRAKANLHLSVAITAILFGLFHVFARESLLWERAIPSTMMGVVLGYICLSSGSIFPGMLLHVIHNGFLITLAHFEKELIKFGFGMEEQQHLPVTWLVVASMFIAAGLILWVFSQAKDSRSFGVGTAN